MDFLKAEQLSNSKWRVLAIPFGGPFKGGRDMDGEFFSPRTDIKPEWFPTRPVIYHHGLEGAIKDAELGVEELDREADADGWWGTVWLNRQLDGSKRYWDAVNALLRAGKMYGSSGSIAHLVRKDRKTGEILVWPHAEQTLTPTPSNFFSRVTASKAVAAFDSAGIGLDERVRALLLEASGDLPPDLGRPAEAAAPGDGAAAERHALAYAHAVALRSRASRQT